MDRREFLKKAGLATLWVAGAPSIWTHEARAKEEAEESEESMARSRVVVAHHQTVTDANGIIDRKAVGPLLNEAAKAFTQKGDARDAWASLLHPFRTSDIFGIRVNCISAKCPSRPELVEAIVESLNGIGIPPEQIIIWDRTGWEKERAGYRLNRGGKGVQCYGLDAEGVGFDEESTVKIPSANLILPLGRLLTRICDRIINVPVIKDHATSGFTFSLKSAYAYLPLAKVIPRIDKRVRAMHTHHCAPQIAELNLSPIIRRKNRVVIGDALLGVFDGGPIAPANWRPNRLLIGKDLVATDTVALSLLEAKREEAGFPSLQEKASHIQTAARLGLGQGNPAQIERVELRFS
ncbi:MAG: DUF362 domain-containing protein [candidate division NC10 bacterium]|nr:DUF362 domain-containing protein [candidate division NC10 bacterium]